MDDNTEMLPKMANELANSKCTLRKKNEAEMKANEAKEKNVESVDLAASVRYLAHR